MQYFPKSRDTLVSLYRQTMVESSHRALWSALDAVSAPVASLIIAAGLVRILGARDYGIMIIALAVSGLSTAMIPAIASATTKFVSAEPRYHSDPKAIARILTGSLLSVALLDVLLLIIAFSLRDTLSTVVFGPRLASAESGIGTIMGLAVASVCLQQIDSVFAATLKGLEQFGRQAAVELFSRGMLVGAALVTASFTRNVHWVLVAYCCAAGAASIIRAIVVARSRDPAPLFSLPLREDLSKLFSFGGWMWLNALATIAFSTVDRIVLGRIAGAAAAAEFNIYVQLAQLVHFIPASLFAFSYPMFSRLGVHKIQNGFILRQLYRRYFRAAISIGTLIAVIEIIFRHKLLMLVGGSNFPQHDLPFALLILGFFLLCLNVVPYCLCLGLGTSRVVSLVTSISMLFSVLATAFLIPGYGISGAGIARLAYGVGALVLLFQANRLLKSPGA
jgi:O-antigen/teichoic acid export membrane protein